MMMNITALDFKRLLIIKKSRQLYRILTSTLIQDTEKTCDGGSSLGTYLSKAKEEKAKVVYTEESGRGTLMSSFLEALQTQQKSLKCSLRLFKVAQQICIYTLERQKTKIV